MQMEQQDDTGLKFGARRSSSSRSRLQTVISSSPSRGKDDGPVFEMSPQILVVVTPFVRGRKSHPDCVCVFLLPVLVSVVAD